MRKIEKDLAIIPNSLSDRSRKECKKTDRKRNLLISPNSRYKKVYDECYKWKDIQDMLASLYKNKCAYCEEKITRINAQNLSNQEEISHTVEHYRPKSKYPWLAFSWDNLLWCCVQCNKNKDNNFEIINKPIICSASFKSRIHSSTKLYNRLEKPKMVHPELEDVIDKLLFDRNGNIDSKDDRVKYTITTCGLDRNYLNGKRKKILDELINKFQDPLVQKDNEKRKQIIKKFKEDSKNMDNEFIAFRIWVLNMFQKGRK